LLRKTCGCKRDEVTGYWRRLHSEECHDQSPHQYYSGAKIKNNEMGKGCGTGGGEVYTGFWWGNLKESDHLKGLGINSRMILNAIRRRRLG